MNGTQHDNNTSATWITGLNEVYILLLEDDEPVNDVYYKVVVTKSGILSPLTVTSVAGNEAGKTSVSIDENRIAGTVYYYKTAQAVDVPELDDVIEQDWTLWNGIDEITATNGDEIVFVEALALGGINYVKSAGKGIVVTQQ